MNEFYLALKMMGEARYKWPMPPERPAIVVVVSTPVPHLGPVEAEALRVAMEKSANRVTGKLIKLPDSPLYVPEMKD